MKRMWIYALLGGVAFWVPDIIAKAIGAVSLRDARMLSFICPAVLLLTYLPTGAWRRGRERWNVSLWMLIGVWVFGPAMISITSAIRGSSWAHPLNEWFGNFLVYAMATVFPPLTFIYSAYDGTVVALVIATLMLGLEIWRQLLLRRRHRHGAASRPK